MPACCQNFVGSALELGNAAFPGSLVFCSERSLLTSYSNVSEWQICDSEITGRPFADCKLSGAGKMGMFYCRSRNTISSQLILIRCPFKTWPRAVALSLLKLQPFNTLSLVTPNHKIIFVVIS